MDLTLRIWRQAGPAAPGRFETHRAENVDPDMSFLEMLDVLNERLIDAGHEPVAFDSDCREGICGSCGIVINGQPHGPQRGTATCQLHMRQYTDGDTITVEPFRAAGFPIVKDLVVDPQRLRPDHPSGWLHQRTDRQRPGRQPDPGAEGRRRPRHGRRRLHRLRRLRRACPNAAAQLFTAAKISHLGLLPQGQPERYRRVQNMVDTMEQIFGSCTNHGECEAVCPKEISIDFIALMHRDYRRAKLRGR